MQCKTEVTANVENLREDGAGAFDDDTIAALIELGEALRKIRQRLVAEEGYEIKDGKLYKPTL